MIDAILVTGGAGFIGSNFILQWIAKERSSIVNIDKLSYAGNLNNLADLEHNPLYTFVHGDITNRTTVHQLLEKYKPKAIINFAAETHVDRSIHHPERFIEANIMGTFTLLNESLKYWRTLSKENQEAFRFLQISTDEVYGSLAAGAPASTENSVYAPNSPYAASKASADHLVRAFHHTYGLPTLTTFTTNNFGPFQFPEKLIPLIIVNALNGKPIPLYGDGLNTRNWIYVEDNCEALRTVLAKGRPGECYNIGELHEKTNIEIVKTVCTILDELKPNPAKVSYSNQIKYVKDRPGHDRRYHLDSSKIQSQLNWKPKGNFESNLRKTIEWYLNNLLWVENVLSGEYRDWISMHYSEKEKL